MTIAEMHIRFTLKMDKADSLANPGFEPEEIDEFLNIAQDRIVKQRYGGNNVKGTSYEEVQKRTEDLKEITERKVLYAVSNLKAKKQAAWFPLPPEHMITVQEEVVVTFKDCNGKSSNKTIEKVKAISHEKYSKLIKNSFWSPNEEEVLRLVLKNNIEIIGNINVTPLELHLTQIKHPKKMSIFTGDDCELSKHLHDEIVTEAVGLAMGAIQDTRIELNLRENATQE